MDPVGTQLFRPGQPRRNALWRSASWLPGGCPLATNSTPIGRNAISRGLNGLTAAYGTMAEVTGQESPQEGRHGKLCLPRPANFTMFAISEEILYFFKNYLVH